MAFDPDNVRVDLLKIKRKLYISYPEGSKERSDFLYASKLSELTYLQKLVDRDLVEEVFQEYSGQIKLEVFNIILSFGIGASLSVMLYGFHQLYTSLWLSLFPLPVLVGIGVSIMHIIHIFEQQKQVKPFKDEYKILQAKIQKLVEELKGLAK